MNSPKGVAYSGNGFRSMTPLPRSRELELKAIEMLKGPKRLVQPEPVDHAWWDDGSGVYSIG